MLVTFDFAAGLGGSGGGDYNKSCVAGGGGGAASYARFSTRESAIAPTSPRSQNCPTGTCVQIVFDLTQ